GSKRPSRGFYAVSVAGVQPSRCITWFQANQACLLSEKRLLTNREWQGAAAGTPDPGVADDGSTTCATINSVIANTGSRSSCKSAWGAFDMIGNVDEWVGDWADRSVSCTNWPASLGSDFSCVGGPGDPGGQSGTLSLPGAFLRGGSSLDGTEAGVFAINSGGDPSQRSDVIGFRCAREQVCDPDMPLASRAASPTRAAGVAAVPFGGFGCNVSSSSRSLSCARRSRRRHHRHRVRSIMSSPPYTTSGRHADRTPRS